MNNRKFTLKADLVRKDSNSNAFLTMSKEAFVLTYSILDNPLDKILQVKIFAEDLENQHKIPLADFAVTSAGFPKITSSEAFDAWAVENRLLQEELVAKSRLVQEFLQENQPPITDEKLRKEFDDLRADAEEVATKIRELGVQPQVEYQYINKYEDVITYFDAGVLTEQGLEWSKTIPLLNGTVGDYIK